MIDKSTPRLEKVRIKSEKGGRKESEAGSQLIRHSSRFLDKLLLSHRGGNVSSAGAGKILFYGSAKFDHFTID